jgi:hypothetical protein
VTKQLRVIVAMLDCCHLTGASTPGGLEPSCHSSILACGEDHNPALMLLVTWFFELAWELAWPGDTEES